MDEVPSGTRELLLFRHAKSAWGDPSAADHDRDLAPRGIKAAKRMGRELLARGLVPDLVLCSTARRARRTLELALRAFDPAPPVHERRSLYLAPPSRLLDIVQRQPESVRRLLLVGHDPGMHTLAQRLAGSGPPEALSHLAAKFPTGACARLGFVAGTWDDVTPGSGRLLDFIRPRDLD
jgi:phosphohistidine phosphatase